MSNSRTWHGSNHLLAPPPAAPTSPPGITRRMLVSSQMSMFLLNVIEDILKRTNTIRYCDVCNLCFLRIIKMNCSVSTNVLIRDGKKSLTANKLSLSLTCSKCLYRFKVFLDPQRAHLSSCTAGGEAQKHSCFLVVRALTPTPLHHPARWIASGHLTST